MSGLRGRRIVRLGFVLTLILIASVAPRAAGPGDALMAFVSAFNAGDAGAAVALFEAEGEFAAADAPPVRGREAIRAALEERFRSPRALDLLSVEISASPGVRIASGRLTLSTRNRLRGADIRSGAYLVVMRRSGASWRIAHFLFTLPIQPDFIG